MNRICVYTCILNDYDVLREPKVYSQNIDYICFSDKMIQSKIWHCFLIPRELQYLPSIKQQRILKICPHKFLHQYDVSIWIDGNISIQNDLNVFIHQYDLDKVPFYTRIHPIRNCIYKEADAVLKYNKDSAAQVKAQIEKYRQAGYPENIGMIETGILLRKHNTSKCMIIDNYWAIEIINNSHRDQLSFNYVCWKHKFLPGYLLNEFNLTKNNFFKFYKHKK